MSQTIPKGVKTAGTRRGIFVPGGVADLNAITVAEALSGDNVSCYLKTVNQTADQASIQDRRWCSSQVFEIPGEKTKSLQIEYTFNLGEPGEDVARLALTEGTRGTFIRFLQKDEASTTFAEGDWYDAVNVECGEQNVIEGDTNEVDRISQKLFIQSEWVPFKQLVGAGKVEWSLAVTGTPTGGTFRLSVNGNKTATIAHNADATAIETALNLVAGVDGATVVGTTTKTVTFASAASLVATDVKLTGGTAPKVTVS